MALAALTILFATAFLQAQPASSTGADDWSNRPGAAVVSWGGNRMDVFIRGDDDTLQHKFFDGTWHDWESLGGILTSAPTAVSWGEGRLDVFVRGTDDGLWHRWFEKEKWFGWEFLGGDLGSDPWATARGPNYIGVFGRSLRNVLQYKWYDGAWHDWVPLGEKLTATPLQAAWWAQQRLGASGIPQYSPRVWQTDEGLPHNTVQSILQTSDGYLWVGTVEGLMRFDGVNLLAPTFRNAMELKNRPVTALMESKDASLWIATDGGGVFRVRGNEVAHYDKTNGLPSNSVKALRETRDGSIWIGTLGGLAQLRDGQFKIFTQKTGLPSNTVRLLCEDDEGNLWIGTAEGLSCFKGANPDAAFTVRDGMPNNSIRSLCADHRGNLWVGLDDGIIRLRDGKPRNLYNKGNGVPEGFVTALRIDQHGDLWIGTYGGLGRLVGGEYGDANKHKEGIFVTELNSEKNAYDQVNIIVQDREGNFWVGAKDGLHRLRAKLFSSYTAELGLSYNNVMSVCEDRAGTVWISTWGGGLDQLSHGRFVVHTMANGLSRDLTLALCEDHDGALWIGTDYNGGLNRLKNGKFVSYGSEQGLDNGAIRVIYEDRQTNLWVGTSTSLHRLRDGKFLRFNRKDGLAGDRIRAILQDHNGRIWIGTDGGLSRKSPDTRDAGQNSVITFEPVGELAKQSVLALYEDKENNLWIGTGADGLWRMSNGDAHAGSHLSHITSKDGLYADEIYEILEDDFQNFWFSSRKGVFRVGKKALDDFQRGAAKSISCFAYGKSDGLESIQCNGVSKPSAWKGKDGRLWFATTKGVAVVNPATANQQNEIVPPVVIEEVLSDEKVQSSRLTNIEPETLNFEPGKGELEFRYTALSLTAPEKNRFKYKLEGVDEDWVDAGSRRFAHYNNLAPGSYQFHVIACNNDGVWNERGAALDLVLLPHFWQTTWFLGACALAGVVGVAGTARYVSTRKLRRQLQLSEREHALERERSRIAKDMHDELGAHLTQIALLSEMARREVQNSEKAIEHVNRIAETAREVTLALNEIVWAVSPQNDNLRKLANYIFHYAEKFLALTDIRCRIDAPDSLPEQPFSAEVRHNILLMVKEALNNVVKHAKATEVLLRVTITHSELQITIQDNGRGFDATSSREFGNGLANMRRRMEEIGGCIQLCSEAGKGTRIQAFVPLQPGRILTLPQISPSLREERVGRGPG